MVNGGGLSSLKQKGEADGVTKIETEFSSLKPKEWNHDWIWLTLTNKINNMLKGFFRYFVERQLLAYMITFSAILLGLTTLTTIQRDSFPRVEFGEIIITDRKSVV